MKVRQYNIAADAFEWRVMTREQLIGETAMQALARVSGRIAWICPPALKPRPSVYIRRAIRDGLSDAEVWEVQSVWGHSTSSQWLRADDDRALDPAEDADDAAEVSRFLVTPLREEIEAALKALARDLPWMKEGA